MVAVVSVEPPSPQPEGEAAPAEGQGVVTGRLSLLVVGLVPSQLVARLTVAQVGLGVLSKVAVCRGGAEGVGQRGWGWRGQQVAPSPPRTGSWVLQRLGVGLTHTRTRTRTRTRTHRAV